MSFALWLQSLVAAVQQRRVAGGQLFAASAARYLHKYKVISFDPDQSTLDEMLEFAVAVAGLYYQFSHRSPALLVSLLMLPLTICEW
eukprot:CAMPEP_0171994194 /NCGR_PEP_ID=MMETSP0993-20121228/278832_1 /TAXON_ID=483369 /ORGANISM="non described non described, Strain CCMP2098" /LENGTH=86 /DNA_ID=CAMNT_0012647267 /DNA_START=330 /DNA_END=588 /DNA_ORIENTATION=+